MLCLSISSPLTFISRTHANSCNSTLWRVMSYVVGLTPRKEAGVGIPTIRSLGDRGTFQSSPIPEVPAAFGCNRLGLAAGGPPPPPCPHTRTHSQSWRFSRSFGRGLIVWRIFLAPADPTLKPWDPSLLRFQGCDISLGHHV